MSTPDQHTAYVIEEHGFETGLRFHLGARVFPSHPEMYYTARLAILACNSGEPMIPIGLPDGVLYRGEDTAPAQEIIKNLNLWRFLNDDD